MDATPGVDVVVPTFRRPEALERCLQALKRQTVAPASVVVVDDSATDRGPAWARNQGWRKGSAAVVAFTDDDCVPAPDWVETLAKAFMDPRLQAVEGRLLAPGREGTLEPIDAGPCVRWCRFPTANMAYRRTVLEGVGGFDERYFIHREDTDLAWRVLRAGHTIVRLPAAVVVHPDRPGVDRYVIDSEIRLYRLDPEKYAECFAKFVNRDALRSGRLRRMWRTLRATPSSPDIRPLSGREMRALFRSALRISWSWRRRSRGPA